MKLKEIIKRVKESCEENNIKPDDNTLLDCSTRILNSQTIKEAKKDKDNSKPTEKQINLLKKLKIAIPSKLTRLEASKLIEFKMNKK